MGTSLRSLLATGVLLAGCQPPPRDASTFPDELGRSTAAGPADPSKPVAVTHDVPPAGPGLRISAPGTATVINGPGAFGGATMADTIAPRTIAPGDVDSTIETRGPPAGATPAPPGGGANGSTTGGPGQ